MLPQTRSHTVEVCAVWSGERHCKAVGIQQIADGFTFERGH
jgi:hypothetical protein